MITKNYIEFRVYINEGQNNTAILSDADHLKDAIIDQIGEMQYDFPDDEKMFTEDVTYTVHVTE